MNEVQLFESNEIRSTMHNGELYFAVADVVGMLAESTDYGGYWRTLRRREPQLVTNCLGLKMPAPNGRMYKIDCANKTGLLRIIQSIPSRKAEPFKQWLAHVGSTMLDEKTNKRLAAHRKLKDTQERFFENVSNREVDEEGYNRIVQEGDDSLFDEQDMHEKYGIDKEDATDDYMNTLLLHAKGFATELTSHAITKEDMKGEEPINEEHKKNNKDIREQLTKRNIKPENLPPETDLKKLKKKLK